MKKKQKKHKNLNPDQLSLFAKHDPDPDYSDQSDDEKHQYEYEVVLPTQTVTISDPRWLEKSRQLACDWKPQVGARVYVPVDKKKGTIYEIVPTRDSDTANKKIYHHPPEFPGLIGYRVFYDDDTKETVYGRQMFPIFSEEISQEQHEQMAKACSLFI